MVKELLGAHGAEPKLKLKVSDSKLRFLFPRLRASGRTGPVQALCLGRRYVGSVSGRQVDAEALNGSGGGGNEPVVQQLHAHWVCRLSGKTELFWVTFSVPHNCNQKCLDRAIGPLCKWSSRLSVSLQWRLMRKRSFS